MSPDPAAPMSYRQLMTELGSLCADMRTGTMFIATTDNHSARVGLKHGEIVSLVFRTQRGLEALDHIRKITAGRFSFSEGFVDKAAQADLPHTAELLAILVGEESPLPPPAPPPRLATVPRAPAPAATLAADHPQVARAQAVIESELTEFVGPIAPLLCRDHVARAVAAGPPWDWRALVEAVAREIGDPAKEERFKQQTLARLWGLLTRQRLVAEAVGLVGRGAEPLLPVGFVVLVVALEPLHPAVPLEGQHVRGDQIGRAHV